MSSDESNRPTEGNFRDVSRGSINTHDSIECNSIILDLGLEEHKEADSDVIRLTEIKENLAPLQPYMSLKETQQSINDEMSYPRRILKIKPLYETIQEICRISEDFQSWRR